MFLNPRTYLPSINALDGLNLRYGALALKYKHPTQCTESLKHDNIDTICIVTI